MIQVNAHGLFPLRGMKQYHGVEKIMQARCLFHVNAHRNLEILTGSVEREQYDSFIPCPACA